MTKRIFAFKQEEKTVLRFKIRVLQIIAWRFYDQVHALHQFISAFRKNYVYRRQHLLRPGNTQL